MHVPQGQKYGIELETDNRSGYTHTLMVLPDVKGRHRPITEQDASLTDYGGVEIVFPPVSASTLSNKRSVFVRTLEALKSLENDVTASRRTGMHINVNTTGWSAELKYRFMAYINYLPDTVIARVGDRGHNNYCIPARFRWWNDYESLLGTHEHRTSLRRNRIEARFPAATTDYKKVAVIITLLQEVEAWARATDSMGKDDIFSEHAQDTAYVKFLDFLNTRPANRRAKIKRLKEVMTNGYG